MDEPRGPRERAAALRGEGTRRTYGTQNPQAATQGSQQQQLPKGKGTPKSKVKPKAKPKSGLEQQQEASTSSSPSGVVTQTVNIAVHQGGSASGSGSRRVEGAPEGTEALQPEAAQLEYIKLLLRR